MADINEYLEGLNYEFTAEEKRLMDIFAESWEHCRSNAECKDCEYAPKGSRRVKMLLCMSYQYAKRIIAAADVAPVRHGHWIGEGDGYADGEIVLDVWNCSECDYCIDDGTDDPDMLPKYCPNCGAKMDKGDDDV